MSNIEFEIMPLPSLVPMRFRLGHFWTLPWAVTSPRDTRQELRSLARFLPEFARTMDQERTPRDYAGLYPVHERKNTRSPMATAYKTWSNFSNQPDNEMSLIFLRDKRVNKIHEQAWKFLVGWNFHPRLHILPTVAHRPYGWQFSCKLYKSVLSTSKLYFLF